MLGELLTTRLKLTLDLRLEFLSAHLDGINPGTAEGEDETPSIHPRDLRPFALRDQATGVVADGTTSSGSSIMMVDTVRSHSLDPAILTATSSRGPQDCVIPRRRGASWRLRHARTALCSCPAPTP